MGAQAAATPRAVMMACGAVRSGTGRRVTIILATDLFGTSAKRHIIVAGAESTRTGGPGGSERTGTGCDDGKGEEQQPGSLEPFDKTRALFGAPGGARSEARRGETRRRGGGPGRRAEQR